MPSSFACDKPFTKGSRALGACRLREGLEGLGHQVWVVTHRKVVAAANLQLARRGKQRLPPRLKPQRIVELAEDGQQWPVGQASPQRGVDLGVEGPRAARIPDSFS